MTQGFPAQFAPPQPAQPQQFAAPAQPQYQQPAQTGQFFTQQDPYVQAQQGPVVPQPQPAPPQFQQPPPVPQQPADTSGFFGGAATISFDAAKGYVKGTPRGGQILDKKLTQQTKLGTNELLRWPDGSPRMQMVLTLQTTERSDSQDDGKRQLFIKGDGPRAAREAFQAVGATDLEIGGWYYQAWVDEKQAKQVGFNAQKIFKGLYAKPGSPDPLAGQHVPAPQPSAPAEQFVQHAAYQQTGVVPMQPNGAPAQFAPQPQQGPIANAPAAAMANFQQAAQYDPAVQAAVGAPAQPQQVAPQPGGQPNGFGAPQPAATGAPQQPPAGQWDPFR